MNAIFPQLWKAKRLYRDSHATFEDYCRERWGLKRQRAYELMGAAAVVQNLSEISDKLPERESHAAPLASLPSEVQPLVWQVARLVYGCYTGNNSDATQKRRLTRAAPAAACSEALPYPTLPGGMVILTGVSRRVCVRVVVANAEIGGLLFRTFVVLLLQVTRCVESAGYRPALCRLIPDHALNHSRRWDNRRRSGGFTDRMIIYDKTKL